MSKDYIRTTGSVLLPYWANGKDGFVYVKTAKDEKWGFPAGKLECFENDQDGIIREVLEETGLAVELVNFLGIWDFESERGNSISNRVYLGKKVGGKLEISRPNEILDLDILSLREIQALFERGDVRAGRVNVEPIEKYINGYVYPLSLVHSVF